MTATLGSFYWLGFETSGLSPDKKRLAWLGAQRQSAPIPDREAHIDVRLGLEFMKAIRNRGAVRDWVARLVELAVF